MEKLAKACFIIVAIFFLMLSATHATTTTAGLTVYTVQKGDWLSKIAHKFGVADFRVIAKDNNLSNPDLIFPGQLLSINTHTNNEQAKLVQQHIVKNTAVAGESCTQANSPTEVGIASWYGVPYHGRKTASGETYDMNLFTVAHPSLPFGTKVCITNERNGKSVVAKVNDRGPFVAPRIIDVSKRIAQALGFTGLANVQVITLGKLPIIRHSTKSAPHRHSRLVKMSQRKISAKHRADTNAPTPTTHSSISQERKNERVKNNKSVVTQDALLSRERAQIRKFLHETVGSPFNTRPLEEAIFNQLNASRFMLPPGSFDPIFFPLKLKEL